MDEARFDGAARAWRTGSRRAALGLLVGGLAILAADGEGTAATKQCRHGKKRCRVRCIPHDHCCGNAECGAVACRDGVCDCAPAVDGADCGGGRQCLNGGCGAPPMCKGNSDPDLCSADAECCSQHCLGSLCLCSLAGKPCHSDFDCCLVDGLRCVGFVCTETA